ncbi:MAG: hypothetical protein ACRC4N_05915 [Gammaproteobacteria bacterium]
MCSWFNFRLLYRWRCAILTWTTQLQLTVGYKSIFHLSLSLSLSLSFPISLSMCVCVCVCVHSKPSYFTYWPFPLNSYMGQIIEITNLSAF